VGSLADFSGLLRDVFIETGTGSCTTLMNAAQHFPLCMSIEQNADCYWQAVERLHFVRNIHLYHGDSAEVLQRVLSTRLRIVDGGRLEELKPIQESVTFWLDAHYMGNDASYCPAGGQCPLEREIEVIVRQNWNIKPIVVIDDANMFDDSVPHLGCPNNKGFWFCDDSGHEKMKRREWPRIEIIDELLPGWKRKMRSPDIIQYDPV